MIGVLICKEYVRLYSDSHNCFMNKICHSDSNTGKNL